MTAFTQMRSKRLLGLRRCSLSIGFAHSSPSSSFYMKILVLFHQYLESREKQKNIKQQTNTRNKHPKYRPPRQKNNSTAAVFVRRVSPSSTAIECLFCLLLSSTSHCCRRMGKVTDSWRAVSCGVVSGLIPTTARKRIFLPTLNFRRRTRSRRQQFVVPLRLRDTAVRVLQHPYQLVKI